MDTMMAFWAVFWVVSALMIIYAIRDGFKKYKAMGKSTIAPYVSQQEMDATMDFSMFQYGTPGYELRHLRQDLEWERYKVP